jgi:hypothetical protein
VALKANGNRHERRKLMSDEGTEKGNTPKEGEERIERVFIIRHSEQGEWLRARIREVLEQFIEGRVALSSEGFISATFVGAQKNCR